MELEESRKMKERTGIVTFLGNPLTLLGDDVKVGQKAPDFTALSNDLKPVSLADYEGKSLIIASVPSLDTPVCSIETARFNAEAARLSKDLAILTVSMDLPFAQKRWCGAQGVDRVVTLSDHRDASFGQNYGVLIKELRLLARCVFVLDKEHVVRYVQVVNEVSKEPEYGAVLAAAARL